MAKYKKLKPHSSGSAITPGNITQPKLSAAQRKGRLLTFPALASGTTLIVGISLFVIFNFGCWQCRQTNNEQHLAKIQCNRATSSNELYEALKASSRSSWPPVTTINGREYVCISKYKVDVTDLDDR